MTKIANPIAEFADIVKEYGLVANEGIAPSNKVVKRFIRLAKQVPDARMAGMIEYPLKEILLVAFFAVLSGMDTWSQIELFGKVRTPWLKTFLKFRNGIPSHDTFRRVFSLIDPTVLQGLTIDFLMENMNRIKASLGIEANGIRLINIDGKQANGTGRTKSKDGAFPNLQTLNIYDASSGICIAMKNIDKKTNEIPAAQEALLMLDISGALLTCDALNTQKKTIEIIKERKGDYVCALKQNHQTFYTDVNDFFTDEKLKEIRKAQTHFVTSIDKAHSQIERRNYYVTEDIKWFPELKDWKGLKAFVCFEKIITDTATGAIAKERRFFISSVTDSELCAEAIRGHWAVENRLHWHLDASFGDDDDMTADKNAYQNFSLFRKVALTLLKMAQPFMKRSIVEIRKLIGMEYKLFLGQVLGTLDDTYLEQALRAANEKKAKA
ncbi:MAG: ISAs1 family transposase [Treponema sp.]|jgi:predicted transposase YbfD/YdcC|nr:ISAs1 family transposase [Treponema sp.]